MKTIARANWEDTDGTVHKNDIYVENGQFGIASDSDCYLQVVESVIKTVLGELQLDIESGIPYFTTVFQDRRHLGAWAAAVRTSVTKLDFVSEIVSFVYSYDFPNEKLKYELTFKATDGTDVTVTE